MTLATTVYVVDDDPDIRESLRELLGSVELPVRSFSSAPAFLEAYDPAAAGCVVVDVRMPGMSGLDLQDKLRELGGTLPIIHITGHGDVPMAVRSLKNGAFDFLEKPFRGQDLIDCIHQALSLDQKTRKMRLIRVDIAEKLKTLTPRERKIVDLIVSGMTTKQIAAQLKVSTQAIDAHRSKAMKKLDVSSVAELARLLFSAQPDRLLDTRADNKNSRSPFE